MMSPSSNLKLDSSNSICISYRALFVSFPLREFFGSGNSVGIPMKVSWHSGLLILFPWVPGAGFVSGNFAQLLPSSGFGLVTFVIPR